MPLNFLNGEPEGANQEAVAYPQSDAQDESDYEAGSVVANVSDLIAIDGPEDVFAYVNEEDTDLNEVAQVDVTDGEVILSVGSDGSGDNTETVDVDGGLFLSPDDFDEDGDFEYEEDETVNEDDGIPMVLQVSGY